MKWEGLQRRVRPLQRKLSGRLPLCPWASIAWPFDPRTLGARPPELKIEKVSDDGTYQKLRFADSHEAWLPSDAVINLEMWNEYLVVFWDHPGNAHFYLRDTPVKAGDLCVDCGACEGFFVFQALQAGASKVICVEPSAMMAQCLARTFSREIAAGRVVVRNAALGATNGSARFNFDRHQPFGGSLGAQGDGVDAVELITLERLVAEMSLPRVDFVKMDIEGAEIQAVEGALAVLKRDYPRLAITTYHRPFDFAALRALLVAAGYRHIKPVGVVERDDGMYRPVMLHAWV